MIYLVRNVGMQCEIRKDKGEISLSDMSAYQFMKLWCLQQGSTFRGREEAARYLLSIKQKVPILISEKTMDIFFPTRSPKSMDCIWINYRSIISYKRKEKVTLLTFRDDSEMLLHEDYRTIQREMRLCKLYIEHLSAF